MIFMLKTLWNALLETCWPKSCHLCGKVFGRQAEAYDVNICRPCAAAMRRHFHVSIGGPGDPVDRLLTCFVYEGPTRELIHRFKYQNRPYLAATLARLMREVLTERNETILERVDSLAPVPLHPARLREREFDQALLLARGLGGPPVLKALRRIRNTRPQATLDQRDRQTNLRGAFGVADAADVAGKKILLLDDVVTTGATVAEAGRQLKTAGATSVCALAFARG